MPGIGTMLSPRVRSHARATCAGVTPASAAMALSSPVLRRLCWKFSPLNRGLSLR